MAETPAVLRPLLRAAHARQIPRRGCDAVPRYQRPAARCSYERRPPARADVLGSLVLHLERLLRLRRLLLYRHYPVPNSPCRHRPEPELAHILETHLVPTPPKKRFTRIAAPRFGFERASSSCTGFAAGGGR